MKNNILDFWPNKHLVPRDIQIKALKWLERLPANIKYIMCEMPVGGGKSDCSITYSGFLSGFSGNSFILTPQKILQKQYEKTFPSNILSNLYGKSNYDCKIKKTNCEVGQTINPKCEYCPAEIARDKAFESPNAVFNYTLAFLMFKYNKSLARRKLIIFDECHTLEHHLVEFNSINISSIKCKKYGIEYVHHDDIEQALQWIETEYLTGCINTLNYYEEIANQLKTSLEESNRKMTKDEENDLDNYKEIKMHIASIDELRSLGLEEIKHRYVITGEDRSFKFKELYGKNVFHQIVKPMADKFLFISSTILNKNEFCNDLGIDPNEAAFISLNSEFPIENRPVFFLPQMKMNYQWKNLENYENRQNLILKLKDILDYHKDESGIIHSGNYEIADWLVDHLSHDVPHDVMSHNPSNRHGMSRDEVIDNYLAQAAIKPTLLISPSITEGLDLKDDLGRFGIFVKVPFMSMVDKYVVKRKELSEEWYMRQAMINVIQGAGRTTRTPTDSSVVYILDSSFNFLYYKMNNVIPQWWKDAFIRM